MRALRSNEHSVNGRDFDVFFCYRTREAETVVELADRLESRGLRPWVADRELVPGRPWQKDLEDVIETIRAAAVLVGPDGRGPWQEQEIRACLTQFRARELPVIPVLLPGARTKPELPLFLKSFTWVDLGRGLTTDGLDRLVWGITGVKPERFSDKGTAAAPDLGWRPSVAHRPRPNYRDEHIRQLSERIEIAYQQKRRLESVSGDTTALDSRILDLKREVRSGPQLHAGEFLADGRFQLIDSLGRGGFATVWEAWDAEERRPVALKLLHGQYAEDRDRRERLFRGARKMAELRHPNIAEVVLSRCEDEGFYFYVMELLEGGDFHGAVLEERLWTGEKLDILCKIGVVLDFAHERGVVHRDVKPANILLDVADRPKLTDFDLVRARDTTGLTRTHAMLGTFLYAAPEALGDAAKVTPASDVYSLAATAVFALLGRELPPSFVREPTAVIDRLEIPASAKGILTQALSLEAAERPTDASGFCLQLRELIELKPCSACDNWMMSPEDTYCAFCGQLQLHFEVTPRHHTLISDLSAKQRRKAFSLHNGEARPLRVALGAKGPPLPWLVLKPEKLILEPGATEKVVVELDEKKLLPDFGIEPVQIRCTIDGKMTYDFGLEVKTGPRPVLVTPEIGFGRIDEHKKRLKTEFLSVRNDGGVPLMVSRVEVVGSSQLAVGEFGPLKIEPGAQLRIPVTWDTRVEEIQKEATARGFRVRFRDSPSVLFAEARAELYRFQVEVDPPVVRISNAVNKRDEPVRLSVRNLGTVEVVIQSVRAKDLWIEVDAEKLPQLLPNQMRQLALVCKTGELEPGKHRGEVKLDFEASASKKCTTIVVEVLVDLVQPSPYRDYIGIDFGTTNSAVALFNKKTNKIELVTVEDNDGRPSELIPSVLAFFGSADQYDIGYEALRRAPAYSDRVVRSVKRIMGYDGGREIFGRVYSPEELASLIIRRLVHLAERQHFDATGERVDMRRAIVTVPADFYDRQIRGILEACRMAGLEVEDDGLTEGAVGVDGSSSGIVLSEPAAAALYFLHHIESVDPNARFIHEIEAGLNLLVVDWRDGSLDVAVASLELLDGGEAGLRIVARLGDNRIGGDSIVLLVMDELAGDVHELFNGFDNDFDKSLILASYHDLAERRRLQKWPEAVWGRVLSARALWKGAAEATKRALAPRHLRSAEVAIPAEAIVFLAGDAQKATIVRKDVKLTLEQDRLHKRLGPTLDRGEQLTRRVLELAKMAPNDVNYVLHTGGQSLMDEIQERIRRIFPSLQKDEFILYKNQLEVCVAKGAALYGQLKSGQRGTGVRVINESRRLPHSYGVEVPKGVMRTEYQPVIPRGTVYPTSQIWTVPRSRARDGKLMLKFYQNSGTLARILDNREIKLIGEYEIDTRKDERDSYEVRFVVSANRTLEIYVEGEKVERPRLTEDEESIRWMG